MPAKPLPKLGQTQRAREQFVQQGTVADSTDAMKQRALQPAKPASLPSGNIDRLPSRSLSGKSVIERNREIAAKREKVRYVSRGYDIPEFLASQLRVISAKENIAASEIVIEALLDWIKNYEATFTA